ncbi:MAG: ABC transporter permease [Pseudomonadota bacterium]
MSADLAAKAQTVAGVTKLEQYLFVRTRPHDVIGIEAEAPLRIITSDGKAIEAKFEVGKTFRKADEGKNVALVGKRVYAEDYGYRAGTMGSMATMKHLLEVGQTFTLIEAGPRIRVLGVFTVSLDAEAAKVFLPLTTVQKLFGREGKLSHLFLTVEGDSEKTAKAVQAALGEGVKVSVVSR